MDAIGEYAWRLPAAPLRPYVSGYTGYHVDGPPGVHQGVPSGHLTLIVSLAGTVDVAAPPDPAKRPDSFRALVGGLHDRPAVIAHDGHQYGLHLDLTWRGARALLGLPASELAGDVVHLDTLLGPRTELLVERLAEAAGWPQRFALLDAVLGELLASRADRSSADPPADVEWAWHRLTVTGGGIPVGELSRELGWSRRHFGERFRRELGLSPKAAARVIRFDRVCRVLRSPRPPALAEAAVVAGYFDQAHLARDFRDLAGLTATEWLAENAVGARLPSLQDQQAVGAAR